MRSALILVLATLLASCSITHIQLSQLFPASSASPTFATVSEPPYLVVKGMYSTLNNGDIEGAMNFFSDSAIYIVRLGPDKGIYIGKDEIRRNLEPDLQNHIISEISDIESATNIIDLLHQRIQNAEAITSERETISVIDGKITGMGVDPESLIRFTFYALNEKQTDGAMAMFDQQPVCTLITEPPLNGKPAIQDTFQQYVNAGDVFEMNDIEAEEYYRVTWTLTVYNPQGRVIADIRRTSDIENGKIENCYPAR